MNHDLPSRVRDLFHAAVARPPEARTEYLRSECGDDRALLDEVLELIRLHRSVEDRETGALGRDPFVGQQVGPYEIRRLIGRGGMGRVYLARRTDGAFDRDVAVKIVDPDRVDPESVARFEEERRILGSLRHPCIAGLLDAGTTGDGLLYLVMEYVDGRPISDYCATHGLNLRARLALFCRVAEGVAEAHRRLVVHRDLKPDNILIDASGAPKLLDFGIAKLVTRAGLEASDPTHPLHRRATPAYASPEQMEGEAAQTAMDIYSLGVILHELLVGRRPAASIHATTRTGEIELVTPSALADRDVRTCPPGLRASDLEGDLDAILLKALSGQPWQRYRSVDELVADIEAYLGHYPVKARGAGAMYRVDRFVRRHRLGVTAAVVTAVALVLATVGFARQAAMAARERDRARAQLVGVRSLAEAILALDATLVGLPGSTTARQGLVGSVTNYLSSVPVSDDAGAAVATADMFRRLGDIQGNPNGRNLGDTNGALASYRAALARLESLAGPPTSDVQVALARTHAAVGDVLAAAHDLDAAEAEYLVAMGLATELAKADSQNAPTQAILAGIHRPLGDVRLAAGDWAAALDAYEAALAIDERNADRHPRDPTYQRLLALTTLRLGRAHQAQGLTAEARADYERAASLLEPIAGRAGVDDAGIARDLALGRVRLGVTLEAELDRHGRVEIARALVDLRGLAESDTADVRARRDLAAGLVAYGDVLRGDDPGGARAAYTEARRLALTLTGGVGDESADEANVARIDERLGRLLRGERAADLQLFRIVDGRRALLEFGDPPLRVGAMASMRPGVPAGWTPYLLAFGADGPVILMGPADLRDGMWSLTLDGPAPAQTVLLLATRRPLGEAEQANLVRDVGAIDGPRAVDAETDLVWSGEEEVVEGEFTARGAGRLPWVRLVRQRLATLGPVQVAGRTFPLRPRE